MLESESRETDIRDSVSASLSTAGLLTESKIPSFVLLLEPLPRPTVPRQPVLSRRRVHFTLPFL